MYTFINVLILSNLSLREEKAVLLKQLKHCQDQVLALTKELEVYQQLLDDPTRGLLTEEPTGEGASGKVHKLLEEIRQLRRQLEQSIHNNVTLSDHLTHKLTTTVSIIYCTIYIYLHVHTTYIAHVLLSL